MPETGGKGLAEDLRIKMPELRKVVDGLKLRAATAVTAFIEEGKNLDRAIKTIEDDAAEMAKVSNEILGNVPPEGAVNPTKSNDGGQS